MEIIAKANFIRISPKKVRLVTKPISKMTPQRALAVLALSKKKAAVVVSKLIESALANAKNNFGLNESELVFKRIEVGSGPTLKRWRAAARGRAHKILKRTTNLTVALEKKEVEKATELDSKISQQVSKAKPDKSDIRGGESFNAERTRRKVNNKTDKEKSKNGS